MEMQKESQHSPEKSNHILLHFPRHQDQQVFSLQFRLFGLNFEELKRNLDRRLVAQQKNMRQTHQEELTLAVSTVSQHLRREDMTRHGHFLHSTLTFLRLCVCSSESVPQTFQAF